MSTKRPGSGRTKGSYSFANVTLKQLMDKFKDPETILKVSRKQLESCGFTGLNSAAVSELNQKIDGKTESTAVETTEVQLV